MEPGEALIRFGPEPIEGEALATAVFNLSPSGDLREAAAALFDTMKQADAVGARRIAFGPVPRQGLGEAIHDRIERAAAPRPDLPARTNVMSDAALIDRFRAIVGERNVVTDKADQERYLHDTRGLYTGQSPAILKPGSTAEVADILRLASQTGTPIVPQGGNTGHVAGQVPRTGLQDFVLSLERMNRIREVDPIGNVLVAEAGTVLETIHAAAEKADRLFPLSLGSQGTAQIGGNLSTNAGGTAVLAYGNMRQLCLGLEVVLPTGEIWNGLRRLKKDNTGYDLRDLFIGAEGTLGVITAAVLKLFPRPAGHQVAIAGLADPAAALRLFSIATRRGGPALTGFELMSRRAIDFTVRHIPACASRWRCRSPGMC